jgi:predicted O-methyltransferase YrrM
VTNSDVVSAEPLSIAWARSLYRSCMVPFGRRKLRQLLAAGLPPQLQPPLSYLLDHQLNSEDQRVRDRVEELRVEIASRDKTFDVYSIENKTVGRAAAWIAHKACIDSEWGVFLYLCAKAIKAHYILELGSSIGISSCYLASAPACLRMVTIEGSSALAAEAEANLARITSRAKVYNALFEDAIDSILDREFNNGIDMAFIDGPKSSAETLDCLERLIPLLHPGSLLVFDDIHWSAEMRTMWRTVRRRSGIGYALDVGRFGVCTWVGGDAEPECIDISKLTGWLRTKNDCPPT